MKRCFVCGMMTEETQLEPAVSVHGLVFACRDGYVCADRANQYRAVDRYLKVLDGGTPPAHPGA